MWTDIDTVLKKLDWMEAEGIWPNNLRYLWTDAFGVTLYVSLYEETGEAKWLDKAKWLVAEVDRVLGRPKGYRIGEAPDRDGQYYHYLAMWLHALSVLGDHDPGYREKGVKVAQDIHDAFIVPGRGVWWKMKEDLSGPYPGHGLGGLDPFDGYISYRLLDEKRLARQIGEMRGLMEQVMDELTITQDLGLGMMLWMTHFFPEEDWARIQQPRCLAMLDHLWNAEGWFAREPYLPDVRIAFTNYGVSVGLQAVNMWPNRVLALHRYFSTFRSGDEYDREAITHVMACSAHFPGRLIKDWRGRNLRGQ